MNVRAACLGLFVVLLSACAAPPPAARPPVVAQTTLPCAFAGLSVVAVEPHRVDVSFGKHAFRRTRGATLVVDATPGLTAEYLRSSLHRHASAARTPDAACPLDVEGAAFAVTSRGDAFAVTVSGPDTAAGDEILRRTLAAWSPRTER